MLRSSSCSSAGLASDTKPEVHRTPLREVIARDAPRPLAPTGRPPLGSFPPCSPSTSKRTCAELRSFFRLPTSVHLPTVTRTWLSHLHCRKAPGTGPFQVCTTRLSPLLVRLAPALSTSLTCSTSRAGFTPTRSMQRCPHYVAGSPQARCLPPPGGHTYAALLATQEEWQTAPH